jgi:hypothetical protein
MTSTSLRRHALPTTSVVLLIDSHDDSREMYAGYLHICGGFTVLKADTTDDGLSSASDADVINPGFA